MMQRVRRFFDGKVRSFQFCRQNLPSPQSTVTFIYKMGTRIKIRYLVCFFLGTASFVVWVYTTQAAKDVVAKINQAEITMDLLNRKYADNVKLFNFNSPSKQDVLEDMIRRELGIQEAKRLGLEKDPEVIDRINTVIYHALLEKQLASKFEKIQVTDSQAESFYKKYPEIRTSHIFVAVAPNGSNDGEAKKQIQEIYDKYVRPGKMGFAEIAQRFSEGVAAPMGGDMDYQTRDKLDSAYYDAALRLKTGQVSNLVRTRFGYHIIKLTAIRTWKDVDRPSIKRLVIEEQRQKLFEAYIGGLRGKAKVQLNLSLLKN